MRPVKLTISSFESYKDKQTVDFSLFGKNGIFLITGETGAGKTTIFDAIVFALYGELSSPLRNKNDICCKMSDLNTPASVILEFDHDDKRYLVIRSIRNNGFMEDAVIKELPNEGVSECEKEALINDFLKNGSKKIFPDILVKGRKEVNEKIKKILRADEKIFRQTIMLEQGGFLKVLVADASERKNILREIFNTEKYLILSRKLEERADKEIGDGGIKKLGRILNGKDGGLDIEEYVQEKILENVIFRANGYLMEMTGRYEIKLGYNEKASCIEVYDNYNAVLKRAINLSGGELFILSLAMAIGLIEEKASKKTGFVSGILFVDEGFGMLDKKSLDLAVRFLQKISKNNCLIGIISHVEELKTMVLKKLDVKKNNDGSSCIFIDA